MITLPKPLFLLLPLPLTSSSIFYCSCSFFSTVIRHLIISSVLGIITLISGHLILILFLLVTGSLPLRVFSGDLPCLLDIQLNILGLVHQYSCLSSGKKGQCTVWDIFDFPSRAFSLLVRPFWNLSHSASSSSAVACYRVEKPDPQLNIKDISHTTLTFSSLWDSVSASSACDSSECEADSSSSVTCSPFSSTTASTRSTCWPPPAATPPQGYPSGPQQED
ncbi:hypothetical protein E2C01_015703 [Portunus trituberculatus]|uniref:Uncharacterized protein n=1 Tax=Portunus trituberculatus TaxID=210409 RepID=A0A5B7DM87_PORTR|nr:hypothetical protein [Portunus trituberculatus]